MDKESPFFRKKLLPYNGNEGKTLPAKAPPLRHGEQDLEVLHKRKYDPVNLLPQMFLRKDGKARWTPAQVIEVKKYGHQLQPVGTFSFWQRKKKPPTD